MTIVNNEFKRGRIRSLTLNENWTSPPFIAGEGRPYLSVQLHINNTDLVGSAEVEISNDGTNWIGAAFKDENGNTQTSITISSGVDVDKLLVFSPWTEAQIRLKFTRSSGSGVLDATVAQKR